MLALLFLLDFLHWPMLSHLVVPLSFLTLVLGCFIINFALETDSREFFSEETFTYVWNAFRGKLHFFFS